MGSRTAALSWSKMVSFSFRPCRARSTQHSHFVKREPKQREGQEMWRTDELRNVLLRGERRVLVRVLHKLVRDLDQLRKHDHSCQFNTLI